MIVAGAGSGKTKVLTTRIAHIMAKGVEAFHILALTFTNKAAAEMKERVEKTLGNNDARNLYIGTFHSVFARILRSEGHRLGYPNNFTIYDTDDSRSVIKTVVNELGLDDKTYKPNIVGNRISAAKNALVSPEEYAVDAEIQREDTRAKRPAMTQVYKAYTDRCFKNGAMDFDDLLLKMFEMLNTQPDALMKYQRKFKYIMIDEYQDTNPVQYQISKLLGAMHENICVVGDDAQSIYSFRGATIENILQFQKDYEDVKVVKLEQNYRSTQSILMVANEVIGNNKDQIPKKLWTDNKIGDKIKVVRTMTDSDEAKFAADNILEQKLRNHYRNSDFAILYRTNAQSRSYEEHLRRAGIPYKIFGGLSFYQRKEVKDLIAYLRLTVNTRDEEALKRIINYPTRGIGKTTIEKLAIIANEQGMTMFEAATRAGEFGFKASTLETLTNFGNMFRYFQTLLADKNAYEVAAIICKHSNLNNELIGDKTAEGVARYENVQELLNSIKSWTETPDTEDGEVVQKDLGAFLQQVTLFTDSDDDKDKADVVKLMSIHAAKGLEFSCVFVGGVEENLFPNPMSLNTRQELEEERRLFYVAVTRAKERLWLTHANTRYKFGQLTQNDPSRFLDEMPEQYVETSARNTHQEFNHSFQQGTAFERMQRGLPPTFPKKEPSAALEPQRTGPKPLAAQKPLASGHIPSAGFEASDTSGLEAGQKVEHVKFGFGTVINMEGSNHNPIANIDFFNVGAKKIMLNYAKLRIVKE